MIGVCAECIFWKKSKPEQRQELGTCVRFPPVVFGRESAQPITSYATCCGEFVHTEREGK